MVGRFIGSYLLTVIAAWRLLATNTFAAMLLLIVTMLSEGQIAMWAVLAIGLFNSIMFPTIFSLSVEGLGGHTSRGSGWLCLAIVGGAIIPLIQGFAADQFGIQMSFLVPLICYVFIVCFAFKVTALTAQWQNINDAFG